MKHYVANQFFRLHTGRVHLTQEQFQRQKHNLRPTDVDDVYEIAKFVGFKAGETFGFDGDIPKTLVDVVKKAPRGETAPTVDDTDTPPVVEPKRAAKKTAKKKTKKKAKKKTAARKKTVKK